MQIEPVAYYRGPFGSKFGIPRQSGLSTSLQGRIVFEPEYRRPEALRGLEGFDRIWILWGFSANRQGEWHPTVRPPRLGGNTAVGVWATRSPYRPNPVGLSCVPIGQIDWERTEIHVLGADLMDGTPVYDIKPYLAYADSYPEAREGFAGGAPEAVLEVVIPTEIPLETEERAALAEVLSLDPRPAYQDDPDRIYGMPFAGKEVHFKIKDNVLTVIAYD